MPIIFTLFVLVGTAWGAVAATLGAVTTVGGLAARGDNTAAKGPHARDPCCPGVSKLALSIAKIVSSDIKLPLAVSTLLKMGPYSSATSSWTLRLKSLKLGDVDILVGEDRLPAANTLGLPSAILEFRLWCSTSGRPPPALPDSVLASRPTIDVMILKTLFSQKKAGGSKRKTLQSNDRSLAKHNCSRFFLFAPLFSLPPPPPPPPHFFQIENRKIFYSRKKKMIGFKMAADDRIRDLTEIIFARG